VRLSAQCFVAGLIALGLTLACSEGGDGSGAPVSNGGTSNEAGDERYFVPEALPNTEQDGEGAGLTLVASTLVLGERGPEYYAAVRNDGAEPACEAGMQTYFYDTSGEIVTSAGTTLFGGVPHRIEDGSGVIVSCIEPGATAMTAALGFSDDFAIDALARLEHRFPAFPLRTAVPVGALRVSGLNVVPKDGRHVYAGTFTNELPVAVQNPSVSVFVSNRVGRPLAMATSTATLVVAPGGTWAFETSSVDDAGADSTAYAGATVSQ
jgi:hypothetical protein